MTEPLFCYLWNADDPSAFRAFVFAALSRIHITEYSPSARREAYRNFATAKRASFLDAAYSSKGWSRCLRLLPKTDYESFLSSDWQSLLLAGEDPAARKALGHVARITSVLVRQLSLIPKAIRVAAVFDVLTALDVPERYWRRLSAALDEAPHATRLSLISKSRKIRSFGGFWDFLFHCLERPWRPVDLPLSFVGDESLEALRTRTEFESEGFAMRNCLAGEFNEARFGRCAFFRSRGSASASVQFLRTPTGWRLGQILGVGNEPLSASERSPIIAAAKFMLADAPENADDYDNRSDNAIDSLAQSAAIWSSQKEFDRLTRALANIRGRSVGRRPETNAYCVFSTDQGYVQFMDQDHGRELLCEIQSHRYSRELDQNLNARVGELLEAVEFSWPRGAQNFRRRFAVSDDVDIRRFALLALCFLREIFGLRDPTSVTVEVHAPEFPGRSPSLLSA